MAQWRALMPVIKASVARDVWRTADTTVCSSHYTTADMPLARNDRATRLLFTFLLITGPFSQPSHWPFCRQTRVFWPKTRRLSKGIQFELSLFYYVSKALSLSWHLLPICNLFICTNWISQCEAISKTSRSCRSAQLISCSFGAHLFRANYKFSLLFRASFFDYVLKHDQIEIYTQSINILSYNFALRIIN